MADEQTAWHAWVAAQKFTTPDEYAAAKNAWVAAMQHAAKIAADQTKRYTCSKCRGVCMGISSLLEKEAQL